MVRSTNFMACLIYDNMIKYRYRIFAGLLPIFVLGFVSHPQISEYFDLGESDTTTLMSSYYLSMSLSLLLAGIADDRWDKKYLLHGASAIIFIGAALVSFRPMYYMMLTGLFLQGIGAGIITVVSQTWVGQNSDRHNITPRFSYMSVVLSLAPLAAPVIGGLMTLHNILCAVTVMFLIGFTSLYVKSIGNHDI